MYKACVKAVYIVWEACGFEHILCTKISATLGALWVSTRLKHMFATFYTTSLPTAFLGLSRLFYSRFSPLSTAPTTKLTI